MLDLSQPDPELRSFEAMGEVKGDLLVVRAGKGLYTQAGIGSHSLCGDAGRGVLWPSLATEKAGCAA